jgi:hypothetical protein
MTSRRLLRRKLLVHPARLDVSLGLLPRILVLAVGQAPARLSGATLPAPYSLRPSTGALRRSPYRIVLASVLTKTTVSRNHHRSFRIPLIQTHNGPWGDLNLPVHLPNIRFSKHLTIDYLAGSRFSSVVR